MEAALGIAREAVAADLRHAGVVVHPGAPQGLEPLADGRDPRPRLAGVDRGPDAQGGRVEPLALRHLRQVERVGRRAHERGRAQLAHAVEARRRVLAAAGDGQRAEGPRPLEPGPEAHEQAEGEREGDAVRRAEPGGAEDERPAARPPGPRVFRLQPADRRAGRPRGLEHADVPLERVGQVRAERRLGVLVGGQLALLQAREPGEVVPRRDVAGVPDARRLQARAPEPVAGPDLAQARLHALPLPGAELLGGRRLASAVEEGGLGHAACRRPVRTVTASPPTRTRAGRPPVR